MHVLTASIVVAQSVARASAAPLIYAYEYVVDDEDAKGEYYNWFGESRRLLGLPRVLFALGSATAVAFTLLAPPKAARALPRIFWLQRRQCRRIGRSQADA